MQRRNQIGKIVIERATHDFGVIISTDQSVENWWLNVCFQSLLHALTEKKICGSIIRYDLNFQVAPLFHLRSC
jgi:hypothetical protein